MALTYHPRPGDVLICDFSGLKEPEMVKRRPIVVFTPRRRAGPPLVTVVPLSTTAPVPFENYHVTIDTMFLPGRFQGVNMWAKCDLLYTFSTRRLDRIQVGRNPNGKRIYASGQLTTSNFEAVKDAVRIALSL